MANCTAIAQGMQFWGAHGFFPEERKYGAKFIVDCEVDSDETGKLQYDSYEETNDPGISYDDLYQCAKKVVTTEQHSMIQRIAQRIADEIFDRCPTAEKVTVTVKKPFVPIGGMVDYTACRITRTAKGANSDGNAVPYTGINPLEHGESYAYANNRE
ncbi:MAG: dihydroneopterin aldolase [Clostridiales bacterium]|nr:dihydroneopterin aldolase [Clostridiales bacterium]